MALVKSSLYNAIVLVVAFTSAVEDEKDGTAFSTTWEWTINGDTDLETQVHSYANVKSKSSNLPVMLQNITALEVSANWSMYPTANGNPKIFDVEGLTAIGAKADVTLDFFLDPDFKQSTNVTNPKFEVMIWFAAIDATEPIGYANGSIGSAVLDGKSYTLFTGHNFGQNNQPGPGQEVFSFVAPENMTSFSQLNVLPLFQYLVEGNKMDASTYLGTAQFGSEAIHSDGKNVTFDASNIDLTIQTTTSSVTPSKTNGAPAKTNGAPTNSKTAPAKSGAVSLMGVEGLTWCWGLLEGAVGVWMLWSWVL
ncbi:MAG: hypothetical protein ASARMPREDX12_005204 [Alectoria sarmentosa]|nr:MAG: hypothetical protein ASARMPREDX12_005204 [Alectoria sarmentosa]